MGGANGSRECAPDDKLRDTDRVTTHAKQADGFRKRSTHPTGFGQPGYETDLLYLACLVALVLGGSGPLAVDGWLLRRSRARLVRG